MWKWLTGRSAQPPAAKSSSSLDLLSALLRGSESTSGQTVNAEKALGVTAVLRCATLLGNGCSQIPFKLYRLSEDGRSRTALKAAEHPVAKLMMRRPNSWQTPSEWRRTMTMHASVSDFGLSIITRGVRGQPLELLPVNPAWVSWKQRDDWKIEYTVSWPDGQKDTFGQQDVFVLRGPSWDSVKGLSAVRYARDAIGLRMAVDLSQARLFKNGTRPGGLLMNKTPSPDEDQRKLTIAAWREANGGAENTGKDVLLEGDFDWKQLGLDNTDAETMALRGQQVEEICRAFGVFPQMVGYTGDKVATYASAEQFFIQHVVHTLQPWHVAWEEACATQFLTDEEFDEGLYFRFTVQALMRGTAKERGEYFKLMVEAGGMKPSELRALEEMDFDPAVDRFRIPMNTTVLMPDGLPYQAPKDTTPPAT